MGTIEVLKPGILSSIQDTGRMGYQDAGVPQSGAFDSVALSVGNRLLSNSDSDAAIEMTMTGGEFRFTSDTVVCFTGAHADDAMILSRDEQHPLLHHQPTSVPLGATLRVGRLTNGIRGYLCVAGGIQSPIVLGSRSALVSLPDAGLGRALIAGDQLPVYENGPKAFGHAGVSSILETGSIFDGESHVVRVVHGAHFEVFSETQKKALSELVFRVSDQSNRAGVRLSQNIIPRAIPSIVSSEGTLPGYVQVTPSGEPIVLGVDGPTTGGYPVIACVIEADLHVLAQCGIRERIQFLWVSRKEACNALRDQNEWIQSIKPLRPIQISWEKQQLNPSKVCLGCDTGEASPGAGRDREMALLPYVAAVSIACGGHAGDVDSMREAITAACEHGCMIGAHPSYPDRQGFGRKEIQIDRVSLGISIKHQLSTFSRILNENNASVSFIKAHGALYHTLAYDSAFARWYWDICTSIFPQARFVGPIGSTTLEEFKSLGIPVLAEGFCDRVYEPNGTLRPRSSIGSCISNPELAAVQAQNLINESKCDLLCVHADSINAIGIAKMVSERLQSR